MLEQMQDSLANTVTLHILISQLQQKIQDQPSSVLLLLFSLIIFFEESQRHSIFCNYLSRLVFKAQRLFFSNLTLFWSETPMLQLPTIPICFSSHPVQTAYSNQEFKENTYSSFQEIADFVSIS